jgi:hypothetical protein
MPVLPKESQRLSPDPADHRLNAFSPDYLIAKSPSGQTHAGHL